MTTRSANAALLNVFPSNLNLPQPDHTAIRLLVALASFEKDKGPETGRITADFAFKIRKYTPSKAQIQSLVTARVDFFNHVYAYMGAQDKQTVDIHDSARLAEGKSLYEKGCEVSNKKRAQAFQYAIVTLYPKLLEVRSKQSQASTSTT